MGDIMRAIYQPRGKALEYSPLAINLYDGCIMSCRYCFGPSVARKTKDVFHTNVQPRKNLLSKLEKDCKEMAGDKRQILLSFMCDIYQPERNSGFVSPNLIRPSTQFNVPVEPLTLIEFRGVPSITRQALEILDYYKMNVTILTKGGLRAVRDFDLLKKNNWSFGTTLSFVTEDEMRMWEPYPSASIEDRVAAILQAKEMGIKTWVSMEPVINPLEAIRVLDSLKDIVDFWKIGKLNHMPKIERDINWTTFLMKVEQILSGREYYIKKDLEKYRCL